MGRRAVKEGNFGAFSTLDEDADGYYVVVWTSVLYTLQAEVELSLSTRLPSAPRRVSSCAMLTNILQQGAGR